MLFFEWKNRKGTVRFSYILYGKEIRMICISYPSWLNIFEYQYFQGSLEQSLSSLKVLNLNDPYIDIQILLKIIDDMIS